ncbi:MAG: 4Fe-4S binding protein [Rikenellaceae bacterium]
MTIAKLYELIEQIGLLTFSTIYNGEVHSRIAHFNGYDNEGLYLRTMGNKPYGRQLREGGKLTVCGHYGGGILNHEDIGAEPLFAPGYSLRIIGDVRYVTAEEIIEGAKSNKMLEVAARDIESYPAMAEGNYQIYRAKCEIFDYDFGKVERSHKLQRTRFAFGGMEFNPAGVYIDTDICISCGICAQTCSFDAIDNSDGYRVISDRCDDCGSCLRACPVGAIRESLVF